MLCTQNSTQKGLIEGYVFAKRGRLDVWLDGPYKVKSLCSSLGAQVVPCSVLRLLDSQPCDFLKCSPGSDNG